MAVNALAQLAYPRRIASICFASVLLVLAPPHHADATPNPTDDKVAAGHRRMVEVLRDLSSKVRRESPFRNPARLAAARQRFARLPPDSSLPQRVEAQVAIAMEEFKFGSLEKAIEHFEATLELLPGSEDPAETALRTRIDYELGVAYLRLGEQKNCVTEHTSASCIFPIRGDGVHRDKAPSRRAIAYFRSALASLPSKTQERVAAEWLINIAAMTIGEWPQAVPSAHRLPNDLLESEAPFQAFGDVAPSLGLDTLSLAGGAVADDFDGDGLPDIVTSSWDLEENLRFFRNMGDGTFEDRTDEANLTGITGGLNLTHADYDNDGDLDLLVLRGGWLRALGQQPNSLLRNEGGGRFVDVTFDAGLAEPFRPTQTAGWADYDLDGDLDLYVGNEGTDSGPAESQLFRNRGDGTFEDVAASAGVLNRGWPKGVAWGDFDGDRFPDLYVSNFGSPNRYYVNQGDGTFEDVAEARGMTGPKDGFPVLTWDFDNDGALDIFAANQPMGYGPGRLFMVAASIRGLPVQAESARLYHGDGKGGFTEMQEEAGLDQISMTMGIGAGDLDNDGFEELYLGTGYPSYDGLMPNVLYWNRGGKSFSNVTSAARLGHLQKGHGIAFADFDHDGDLDIFEQMGGFFPDNSFADALFENPGPGGNWLKVELSGTSSNRNGIGARIRATFVDGEVRRTVYRFVGSGGTFGANPYGQHLGLGAASEVAELEIYWPRSETRQVFRNLAAGQSVRIVEGSERLERLALKPTRFVRGAVEHHHAGH